VAYNPRVTRGPGIVLCLLMGLGASVPAHADDADVAWRLRRSDFLRYERTNLRVAGAQEQRTDPTIVTICDHDLQGGQYGPAAPVVGDLLHVLAFRLPAPGAKSSAVKLDLAPLETGMLRIKGEVMEKERGPRLVRLAGTYAFKSRGKGARTDRWWYADGEATTDVEFDLQEGVVQTARIVFAYERENLKASGPEAVAKTKGTYEFRLKELVRARPEDFQARVDAAIDAGLKHLRTRQEADGTFKPHGGYTLGTTALAVFTLVACGVPRDDPAVERALAWMFTQEPRKTYEQAVCLMAVDRAWTPQAELDLTAQGKPVPKCVRDLPPKHMAWARRTAEALERNASSPGSWGYPPDARSLLRFDTSNSQYAVLGLRAATHLGYEVREQTWLGVIRHVAVVLERKGPKGVVSLVHKGEAVPDESKAHLLNLEDVPLVAGCRYSTLEGHDHVDAALTCAGISCLLIARNQLESMGSRKWNAKLSKDVDRMLASCWGWLQAHWRLDRHPGHPSGTWYWYFLYSLERAGMLAGVKRVGGSDWYYEGALQLLVRQQTEDKKQGAWNDKNGDATPPTCFGLLFLKRGTSPLSPTITGR